MAYYSCIKMNGYLFSYTDRKYTKFRGNNKMERSLNNTGHLDHIGSMKGRWTFTFDKDSRGISRLEGIFNLSSNFVLVDWDGSSSYNVGVINDWSPNFNGEDNFTVTLDLEQI